MNKHYDSVIAHQTKNYTNADGFFLHAWWLRISTAEDILRRRLKVCTLFVSFDVIIRIIFLVVWEDNPYLHAALFKRLFTNRGTELHAARIN